MIVDGDGIGAGFGGLTSKSDGINVGSVTDGISSVGETVGVGRDGVVSESESESVGVGVGTIVTTNGIVGVSVDSRLISDGMIHATDAACIEYIDRVCLIASSVKALPMTSMRLALDFSSFKYRSNTRM